MVNILLLFFGFDLGHLFHCKATTLLASEFLCLIFLARTTAPFGHNRLCSEAHFGRFCVGDLLDCFAVWDFGLEER